jgi:hypothetical protein
MFQESMEAMCNTLSAEHQTHFKTITSHKEIIAEIRLMSTKYAQRSKLVKLCTKISRFADSFAPFFDVVNIYCQIKPEWINWFWGSLRLVFQV